MAIADLFDGLKKKYEHYYNPENLQPEGPMSREQIENIIQAELLKKTESNIEMLALLNSATAGSKSAKKKLLEIIEGIITEQKLSLSDLTPQQLALEVYKASWGLDVLEELYDDPTVYELRVNGTKVFTKRVGRNESTNLRFENDTDVEALIKRLIQHDFGVALSEATPLVESMRDDDTRITAISYPIVPNYCLVLRKHNTFEITPENLERSGTMSKKVWAAIELLYKGGMNIIFSGNTGSGKTSKLRALVGSLHPDTRIVTIEKDRELRLSDHYPNMDIVELEAHPNIGCDMDKLFEVVLRFSPDVIIVGEFRGSGEVIAAVDACTRGHRRALATAHFNSPEETVEGSALLMLREGLRLDMDLAKLSVARAFNVIVQLRGDSITGKIKLDSISQLRVENKEVIISPLITWKPYTENYMGEGEWVFQNLPHHEHMETMFKYGVTEKEVIDLWRS